MTAAMGSALAGAVLPGRADAGSGERSEATLAARARFFGAENLDADGTPRRDRVVLSWFGVSNFALAMGGRVLLLDAWIPRGVYSGYVPATVQDLIDLGPSHVLIGHGHFDHAADAPEIAAATGAQVVGTLRHCRQVRRQAGRPIATRAVITDGAAPGRHRRFRIGPLRVEALAHVHSAPAAPSGESAPLILPPDLLPCLEHPPTLEDALDTLSHQTDQEGGVLAYRLSYRGFSLVWHDSSGPLATDGARALQHLRTWRRPDVHVGAIQGFGQYTNGLRDPMYYVAATRPRVFVPAHHDNWLPPLSTSASRYEPRLREALRELPGPTPELRMLTDPADYVEPRRLTFPVA